VDRLAVMSEQEEVQAAGRRLVLLGLLGLPGHIPMAPALPPSTGMAMP